MAFGDKNIFGSYTRTSQGHSASFFQLFILHLDGKNSVPGKKNRSTNLSSIFIL